MTEDEMVGWHHQLNGHEFEQTLGVGDRQGNLVCCSPQGGKESDTTQQVKNDKHILYSDSLDLLLLFVIDFCLFVCLSFRVLRQNSLPTVLGNN